MRIPFQHVTSVTKAVDAFKLNKTLIVDAGAKVYKFNSFWDFELSFRSVSEALAAYRGGELGRDRTTSAPVAVEIGE